MRQIGLYTGRAAWRQRGRGKPERATFDAERPSEMPSGAAMPTTAAQRKTTNIPQTGVAARLAIRNGEWDGPTSGMAPGYVQGNLAILPAKLASDFMRFCQLNPK